jgi:membrane-associated protease RseP (regulator of RpoE activity)
MNMQVSRIARARHIVVGTCCALLLGAVPGPVSAAAEPDRAALEKQLQAARQQLDKSAREIADLSRQLYGGEGGDVMSFVHGGPRGSMLGINISGGAPRDEGVAVVGVSPGGPAEQAGLKAGDVVTAVDGKALRRSGERSASAQLVEHMRGVEPGKVVKVDYLRDGKQRTVSVTTAPAEPPIVRMIRRQVGGPGGDDMPLPGLELLLGREHAFHSLELVSVTPKLGAYFGTDRGLLVVRAPAAKGLPLEEGDVLQTIDGRAPDNPGHAFRILQSYQPGDKAKLGVLRQRKQLVLEATMPAPEAGDMGPHQMHQFRELRIPAPTPRPAPPAPGGGPA